jgi:hypothetical protein
MGCDGENKRTRRNNKTNGCLYDSWITLSTTRFCKESCEEGVAFHMACSNSASHDVIQFLYDAFPNAAHMTIWDDDDDGALAAADKEVDAAALAAAVAPLVMKTFILIVILMGMLFLFIMLVRRMYHYQQLSCSSMNIQIV